MSPYLQHFGNRLDDRALQSGSSRPGTRPAGATLRRKETTVIKLTWLPNWRAYAVRCDGRIIGMVRCKEPIPFRVAVEFA
jgi:hypothetical protein